MSLAARPLAFWRYSATFWPTSRMWSRRFAQASWIASRSFRKLLLAIDDAWTNRRDQIREVGRNVANYLQNASGLAASDTPLSPDLLSNALAALRHSFDSTHGGFGGAPVPARAGTQAPPALHQRYNDPTALHMVRLTLTQMARGGMYDQIGGGFSRLQCRCEMAGAALREDALRQRTPHHGVCGSLAGQRAIRSTSKLPARRSTTY